MPDLEPVFRSLELELHVCRSESERQFAMGRHPGLDRARKQIAWITLFVAMIIVGLSVCLATPAAASDPSPPSSSVSTADAQSSATTAPETEQRAAAMKAIFTSGILLSATFILLGLGIVVGRIYLRRLKEKVD